MRLRLACPFWLASEVSAGGDVALDPLVVEALRLPDRGRPMDYLRRSGDTDARDAVRHIVQNFASAENPSREVRVLHGASVDQFGRVSTDFLRGGRAEGRATASPRECCPETPFDFAAVARGRRLRGAVVVISQEYGGNLWHFLAESLPRLLFVPSAKLLALGLRPNSTLYHVAQTGHLTCLSEPKDTQQLRDCVAGRSWDIPHFAPPLMELFGIKRRQIIAGNVASASIIVVPPVQFCAVPVRWTLRHTSRILRNSIGSLFAPRPFEQGPGAGPRALFIRRRTRRRQIANEAEVLGVLQAPPILATTWVHDVDWLMAPPSILEQCRQFAWADVVLGPHGAALSLCMCSRPGAAIVEFVPPPVHLEYFKLAVDLGLSYRGIYVEGATRETEMRVDSGKVLEAMRDLLPARQLGPVLQRDSEEVPQVQPNHLYEREALDLGAPADGAAPGCGEFESGPALQGRSWPSWRAEAQARGSGAALYGTHHAQRLIAQHQNPADCSRAKFLTAHLGRSGLGSNLHLLGRALGLAMQVGKILIHTPDPGNRWHDSSFCPGRASWDCWFLPATRCAPSSEADITVVTASELSRYRGGQLGNFTEHYVPTALQPMLASCSRVKRQMWYYWWHAQSVAYLVRVNPEVRAALDDMRRARLRVRRAGALESEAAAAVPGGTIFMYIRASSFKRLEAEQYPYDAYHQQAERLAAGDQSIRVLGSGLAHSDQSFHYRPDAFASRTLLINADRSEDMSEALSRAGGAGNAWTVLFMERNRTDADPEYHSYWHGGATNKVLESLLDLELALEASAWVCTLSSNWCQLIDELRMTVGGKASSPFVNLDQDVLPENRWGEANYRWFHRRCYTIF